MAKVNVCCSIEIEPKTLNQAQINLAREVAADVAQKMEPKEASAMLIEESGSGSVVAVKEMEQMEGEQVEKKAVDCTEKEQVATNIERACHCSCNSENNNNDESADHVRIREPLSAPF